MLTYAIQRVGYDYLETQPQGETDLLGFLTACDAFPWADQIREWDKRQSGPLPALVLQNAADQRELWVTALSTNGDGSYQLQAVSVRMVDDQLGSGRPEPVVAVVEAIRRGVVGKLCAVFSRGDYEALDLEIESLGCSRSPLVPDAALQGSAP